MNDKGVIMRSKYFATVDKDNHIVALTDSSHPVLLEENQVEITLQEYLILRAVDGDLKALEDVLENLRAKFGS